MRSIYRKIAKEHGVSVEEVKREMQTAIDHAYKKHNKLSSETKMQSSVPSKGEVPTAEEFIKEISNRIRPDSINKV